MSTELSGKEAYDDKSLANSGKQYTAAVNHARHKPFEQYKRITVEEFVHSIFQKGEKELAISQETEEEEKKEPSEKHHT